VTTDGLRRDKSQRDQQYRAAGLYLVRYTRVLITLWDGRAATSAAGTASIVEANLFGALEVKEALQFSAFDSRDRGPVIHLQTRRPGSAIGRSRSHEVL
jgi:hypothetical protein